MLQRSIKSIVEYLGSCLSKILWQHVTNVASREERLGSCLRKMLQHSTKSILEVAWERCHKVASRASWNLPERYCNVASRVLEFAWERDLIWLDHLDLKDIILHHLTSMHIPILSYAFFRNVWRFSGPQRYAGWWLTYPSEKYEFVSWAYYSQ